MIHLTCKDLNPIHFGRRVVHKLRIERRKRLIRRLQPVFNEHTEQMKRFKDTHAGGRCFLIGNGPSLNEMDLGPLKNEITFGVNAIYLKYKDMEFEPTYYSVEDVFVAEDRAKEINRLPAPAKFFPRDLAYCLKPRPGVVYVNFRRGHDVFPSFSHDAAEIVYWGSTVTYMNMQLAYYMGIRTVYMIGMDFNYKVPDYVEGADITSREDDVNHFDPNYFGKGYRWHHPRLDRVKEAFELARKEFEADGRRIVNATVGGKLELFPREDYADVIVNQEAT